MKQLSLFFLLIAIACATAQAQTAPTQSSTNPTAATDNAVNNTQPPSTAPANPNDATKPAPVSGDEPTVPTVKTFPDHAGQEVDPRIAVPPLPKKKVTLIGGQVREIDPIRNRMTVDVFGGKSMKLIFDDRTKVTRDGSDFSYMNIHKGDRVYLDTQLYQEKIYAKQIQVVTKTDASDVSGQIVSFNPKTRELELRDSLSARPFQFVVDKDAAITANGGKAASLNDLQPGSLVTAHFNASRNGGTIRDINVLAEPGAEFTLYGPVNHVDLRAGRLAVQNKADDKAYEVKFDPSQFNVDDLAMGSEVSVTAKFNGQDYVAQSLNVLGGPRSAEAARVESDEKAASDNDAKKEKKEKKHKKNDKESNETDEIQNPK